MSESSGNMVPLASLESGVKVRIVSIDGGRGMQHRLESLGVRPGKILMKVSAAFMGGPVTVLVDGRQVAMGRGIARRVMVERNPQ
ncbi:MAG TPA: FeoA family protein [Planctomycetota bacterium]|nr:FeoA family protein [Planctomycetota bacterium]HUV40006.1 FeoA family protein [Planctomycetota bacterium]